MAKWTSHMSYNHIQSLHHAYAYGLVHQPEPQQSQGNLNPWGQAGAANLSPSKVTPAYYGPTTPAQGASSSDSQEQPELYQRSASNVAFLSDQGASSSDSPEQPELYQRSASNVAFLSDQGASSSDSPEQPELYQRSASDVAFLSDQGASSSDSPEQPELYQRSASDVAFLSDQGASSSDSPEQPELYQLSASDVAFLSDQGASSSDSPEQPELYQLSASDVAFLSDQGASSSDSPEQDDLLQLSASDVAFLCEPEASQQLQDGAEAASSDPAAAVAPVASNDSTSDTETCISPGSWSSGSCREGSLPLVDLATWAQNLPDLETSKKSPDATESASSTPAQVLQTVKKEDTSNAEPEPPIDPDKPKAKARSAFSERQMGILTKQFLAKHYLTPAEMRNMAEMTGLTYKQVKTWFQNRRMKLRRHHKDANWVSQPRHGHAHGHGHGHGHATNNGRPVSGGVFNVPPQMQHYQGNAQPQLQHRFNQNMMIQNVPQNLTFNLTPTASFTGAAGYPAWPSAPNQAAMAAGWSPSPGNSQWQYNPVNAPANTRAYNVGFEMKDGAPVSRRSFTAGLGHGVGH